MSVCGAQSVAPAASPASGTQPEVPSPSPSPDGSTSKDANAAAASAIEGFYDKKPQDGTAAQKADQVTERLKDKMTASELIGGGPLADEEELARFQTYLGVSPVSEAELADYSDTVKKIEQLLRDKDTFEAWKQLFVLGEYRTIDAGISRELANRIEAIWNAGRTTNRIHSENAALREDVKASSRNADLMSERIREQEIRTAQRMPKDRDNNRQGQNNGGVPTINQTGVEGGAITPPDPSTLLGKLQLTDEYLTSLEARAQIKLNQLKAENLLDEVKKEFAGYVAGLFEGGWYSHVVLAADFYRRLFDQGTYPVEMAAQVNESLERSRGVYNTIDVFNYKVERSEMVAATNRLAQGFLASAYHPALLSLAREKKQKVADYLSQLDKVRNLVESRDFAGLEKLTGEIKETVTDFDPSKPMALVNAAKLESQLRLGKAKLYAQQGNVEVAMQEFEAAAKAWPANPDLQDKAFTFFNSQDAQTQALVEFDRMVEAGDYRGIFEKQIAIAPALKDDEKRQKQLADALLNVKNAEVAIEKANTLVLNGDSVGAWETIELASRELPDDAKLNKLRADLSGKSAEFVSALNKAIQAEGENKLGYSLTWYVIAQRKYPPSRMANEGVKRLSDEILTAAQ
jgi:tetratricopeptide (TPR) repeat protein